MAFQSDDSFAYCNDIADDDFGGTSPVSVLITVLVADCRYFAPYCPALNHRAEQSDGDSIFEAKMRAGACRRAKILKGAGA